MLAFAFTAAVAWAALSVAVRLRLDGRAETAAGATVVACALIVFPVFALGAAGALTRGALGASVVGASLVAWAASCRGAGVRPQLAATARALAGILRMPAEGLRDAWRRRSATLPCLAVCFALFAYCVVAAYFAPAWRRWDALWYHEPIVGFSIQNHSFAPVDLQSGGSQKINGYPRAGEMLSLWLAMWGGRALIDMPNALLVPAFFASVFAMARRLGVDRVAAAGWAAVVCTIPAYLEYLQTPYVDPTITTFVAAGAMFTLRSPPRSRELLLGAAALAIAANVKVSGVFPVLALALLASGRLLRARPRGIGHALATLTAGAALIVSLSAVTYLGNLAKYHNPVWPDLRVDVPALGIDWPGNYPFGEVRAASVKGSAVAKNVPLKQLLQELFTQPGTIKDDEQRYIHTYGLGVPWVLLPAALFVAGRLALAMLRGGDGRSRARLFEVVGLLATAIVTLVASTNRSTPRYHVMTLALWAPLVAWAFARYRALQSALVLAATVGSLAILAWEMPGWRSFPSPSQLVELARLDPPLREITPELGAPVVRAAGVARDRELGPGAVVVSNDFVFPAVLWNDDYSNRVVFVRASEDLVAAAEHLGATWIYASDKPSAARVRENPRWSEIGPLYAEGWGTAFRRRQD